MQVTNYCYMEPILLIAFSNVVGNTDGLIKGKRYFTCPPKHGKIVRITSIVAILPNKVHNLID